MSISKSTSEILVEDIDKEDTYPENSESKSNIHESESKSSTPANPKAKSTTPVSGKQLWTQEEDDKIRELVKEKGPRDWPYIASKMEGRNAKQCSKRWNYKLSPFIHQENAWTLEEDKVILSVQKKFGNRWSSIARMLPGRSDLSVKNRFYSLERHKLNAEKQMQSIEAIDGLKEDIDYIRNNASKKLCTQQLAVGETKMHLNQSNEIKTDREIASDPNNMSNYNFDFQSSYIGGYPSYPMTYPYMVPYGYPQQMMYHNPYMYDPNLMSADTSAFTLPTAPQSFHMPMSYESMSSGIPSRNIPMSSSSYYTMPSSEFLGPYSPEPFSSFANIASERNAVEPVTSRKLPIDETLLPVTYKKSRNDLSHLSKNVSVDLDNPFAFYDKLHPPKMSYTNE